MSRNNSSSILQSLTATYTDSEGEEETRNDSKQFSPENSDAIAGEYIEKDLVAVTTGTISTASPDSVKSGTSTPQSGSSLSAREIRRVAARLVSYNNDEAMSDDESEEEDEDSNSRVEFPVLRASRPVSPAPEPVKLLPGEELLPPEPTTKCPPELQEKIAKMYEKMKLRNFDMNYNIQQRKQFRNPSIYEKLIEHLDIEEIGTNYPAEIYNPYQWGPEDFYEHLSKLQREEMEKREKDRRERTKVEFVSGTAPKKPTTIAPGEEEKKRKSKWDQPVPAPTSIPTVTVATGTKTAIPAFGSLPKKPKPA